MNPREFGVGEIKRRRGLKTGVVLWRANSWTNWLEWDFIQARAESLDIDSLGWTDLEFSCLNAILDHKRDGHQGDRCSED
jgi:hypothetical protein